MTSTCAVNKTERRRVEEETGGHISSPFKPPVHRPVLAGDFSPWTCAFLKEKKGTSSSMAKPLIVRPSVGISFPLPPIWISNLSLSLRVCGGLLSHGTRTHKEVPVQKFINIPREGRTTDIGIVVAPFLNSLMMEGGGGEKFLPSFLVGFSLSSPHGKRGREGGIMNLMMGDSGFLLTFHRRKHGPWAFASL